MKTEQRLQAPAQVNAIPLNENDEGGLDLGQLLAALRRRALLIVGVTAAVTLAAGVKAFSDTPVYSAKFEILVQRSSTEETIISSVPASLTGESQNPSPNSNSAVSPDLIKILTSAKVLRPVAEELHQQFPGTCNQLIAPEAENPTEATAAIPEDQLVDLCYKVLSSKLRVGQLSKGSSIIAVTYEGLRPNEVEAVLDLTSKAYLNYSLESRQADIQRAMNFVKGKLPDLRDRVSLLQDQLQQLRQRYNLIDPASRGAELSGQINAFRQQHLQSQVELDQARARSDNLQSQLSQPSQELAASSALSGNSRYQTLIGQLLQLDAEIAQASSIYQDAAPEMQVLREQRQNLLSLLAREGQVVQTEVGNQLEELEVRDRSLQETLSSLNTEVNELAVISRIYTDIQRELDISTENLSQFLARQEALQIDAAQRETPWELLTPTTDPAPTSASLPRNLVLGGVLGLLLGVGAALLLERMTDVVYTPEELKRITGLPLLAAIPYNESLQGASPIPNFSASLQRLDTILQSNGESSGIANAHRGNKPEHYYIDSFSEAFRSLYANIRLLNSDSPIRSLVISSTQSGEGKSTTAVHLAMAAAAMTRRVLLVETDLRNPKLREYLGVQNSGGLIDVVAGDLSLKEAVQRSPFEPNMFVLTAGATPPDPTRLISSQKMQRLMEQFQNNFDLVIYDAPPLVGFADAYLMSAHTNGIILVAEAGKLKRSLLEQALEQVKVARTPILGVVVQKLSNS